MFRVRYAVLLAFLLLSSVSVVYAKDSPYVQTTVDEEVEQAFQFICLDPNYRHAKNLPLINKIVGLPYSSSAERVSKEVDDRVKNFRETHKNGTGLQEARAVLQVDDSVTDEQVKRRAQLVDETLAIDPAYTAEHPHGTRSTFLLFPHND